MRASISLALLLFGCPLAAQVQPGHLVVATRLPGNPATGLLDVDPGTGQVTALGRFPSDNLPPLGVVLDPTNGNLVVGLDAGGTTRLVRLQMQGAGFAAEQTLASLPGLLTDLALGLEADLFATVGGAQGGLFRIPRRGGNASLVAALPRASALTRFRHFAGRVLVLQDGAAGPPAVDPQVTEVDLATGNAGQVAAYTGYTPRQLTGIVDFPTAVVQQLLGNPDGTVAMSLFFSVPMVLPAQPVLPAGAVTALHGDVFTIGVLALGDSNHPFLNRLDPFRAGGPTWTRIAGPLPGNPVDFDSDRGPRATMHFFGADCGGTLRATSVGGPVLGSPRFAFAMRGGVPNAPALIALGGSEIGGFGPPPQIPLPGGCPLLVTPDAVFFRITDGFGGANQNLPIPNNPTFLGTFLYAQWFQGVGAALAASAGIAGRVGT